MGSLSSNIERGNSSSSSSSFGMSVAFHSVGNMSASFTSTMGEEDHLTFSSAPMQKIPHKIKGHSSSSSSSFGMSVAFHSVGNMSTSFTSTAGEDNLTFSSASVQKIPHDVILENAGEEGGGVLSPVGDGVRRGEGFNLKKSPEESNNDADCSARSAAEQGITCHDNEEVYAPVIKSSYADTNINLKPIQENEADDSSNNGDKFAQSSLMLSLLEGEFMQSSATSFNGASSMDMNELLMSMDSTAFNSLLKQSQGGESMNTSLANSMSSTTIDPGEATRQSVTSASSQGDPPPPLQGKTIGTSQHSERTLKTGDSMSSMQSSATSEDDDRANNGASTTPPLKTSRESSTRRRRLSRADSTRSMMSEISQWTKNNPFDNSSSELPAVGYGGDDRPSLKQQRQMQMQQLQGDSKGVECPVDLVDSHSLGGSMENSLTISGLMSSMVSDGDGLSESIQALDISRKEVERTDKKGRSA